MEAYIVVSASAKGHISTSFHFTRYIWTLESLETTQNLSAVITTGWASTCSLMTYGPLLTASCNCNTNTKNTCSLWCVDKRLHLMRRLGLKAYWFACLIKDHTFAAVLATAASWSKFEEDRAVLITVQQWCRASIPVLRTIHQKWPL